MKLVEPGHDAGGAQQLRQGVGLLVVELDHVADGVGVFLVVDDEIPASGAVGDDAYPLAFAGGEVMPQSDPR
ncbi:hypothetical protein ACFQYP_26420 [Nonomuraea antimicrobica]